MRSTVYVLTKLSMLQSIDAETGRTNWVRMVGDSTRPSEPPAVNHHYVAMINGSDLYVMDRESGETLWKRRLTSAPISALAVSTQWMFIPSISGSMTAMNILNPEEFWSFQSGEAVEVPPVVTRDTVAWVTRYGRMFMGEKATTRVTRRFDTTSTVSAGPVYWPPYIFLASNDGYLNAVDERSGVAVWRYATGAPIYRPPVAVDSGLFALTEPAGLHSMNQDGTQNWLSPEIVSFLSCTPGRIYAVDRAHRIVAMDRSTGRIMGALPLADQSTQLTNMVNDRIYVCTNKGLLQCLHEIGQEEPLIHKPPAPETVDDTANGNQPPAAGGIDG
jgi:outer membrane protein assembly factor BamB